MWMGGVVPIGYRVKGRSLVPVPAEAALVRRIFVRYCALGSVTALRAELDVDGVRTPERRHRNGGSNKGAWFHHVAGEVAEAEAAGVEIAAICWYPIVDCPVAAAPCAWSLEPWFGPGEHVRRRGALAALLSVAESRTEHRSQSFSGRPARHPRPAPR
jgi:hypothetical protein